MPEHVEGQDGNWRILVMVPQARWQSGFRVVRLARRLPVENVDAGVGNALRPAHGLDEIGHAGDVARDQGEGRLVEKRLEAAKAPAKHAARVAADPNAKNITPRLANAATLLKHVGESLGDPEKLTQTRSLNLLGAETLRRHKGIVGDLLSFLGKEPDSKAVARDAEQRRLKGLVETVSSAPWAPIMETYRLWLRSRAKPISERTEYRYLVAAHCFLAEIEAQSIDEIEEKNLGGFASSHEGYRASLKMFATWLEAATGRNFQTSWPKSNSPKQLDEGAIPKRLSR